MFLTPPLFSLSIATIPPWVKEAKMENFLFLFVYNLSKSAHFGSDQKTCIFGQFLLKMMDFLAATLLDHLLWNLSRVNLF